MPFVTYQLERKNAKINDVNVDRLLKNLKRTGAAAYKEWLAGQ